MWVSMRRRPITSPPGGGTTAWPQRASSGPARRMEARISRQSSSSSSWVVISAAWTRTSLEPVQSASAPTWRSSASIVSTSLMRGTFSSITGSAVSRQPARMGSAAFLLPAVRTRPERRLPPSITKDCLSASATAVCTAQVRYPRGTDACSGLGDAHGVHEKRGALAPRARRGGLHGLVRARLRRGRGALARRRPAARLRLRDPPHARRAPAGRGADPAWARLPGGRRRGRALACRAPGDAARHAAQEDALRLRRALGFRRGLLLRAAGRDRHAGAAVHEEEAEAAVVRSRGAPGRGLRRRRAARPRPRPAHRKRHRGDARVGGGTRARETVSA